MYAHHLKHYVIPGFKIAEFFSSEVVVEIHVQVSGLGSISPTPTPKGFFLLQRYSVKHGDDNRAVLTFNLDRHFDLDVG